MKTEFDSAAWRETRDMLLQEWMLGHQPAVDFLLDMFDIAETWDDLVDNGAADTAAVDRAFITALYHLPTNPFFQQFNGKLTPVILIGVNAWLDSRRLEQADDTHSQIWAYALRDLYMELVPACAEIVGGFDHMRAVSMAARQFFQAETFEQYRGAQQ